MSVSDTSVIFCTVCGLTFARKFTLRRHMIKFHRSEVVTTSRSKLCNVCSENFGNETNLRSHMDIAHPTVKLVIERKKFYCMEEFQAWKCEIEKKTQSYYVKQRADYVSPNGKITMYFFCHRSGQYKSKAKDERQRRLKNIGSNKIGKICPAHITVYQQVVDEAMELEVEYQSTHIGHKLEVGRLPIIASDKVSLAGQMNLGVPKSRILSNLRTTVSPTKCLYLITKKDLHNICQSFNIEEKGTFDLMLCKHIHPVCRHFNPSLDTLQSNDSNDLAVDETGSEVIQYEEHATMCKELKKSAVASTSEDAKAEILSIFTDILNNNDGAEEIKDIRQTVIALKARTEGTKAAC